MDVQLRISADVTLRVDSHHPDGSVCIRQYSGVEFEKAIHERQYTSMVNLSKSEARAFASAIMGCAAEA